MYNKWLTNIPYIIYKQQGYVQTTYFVLIYKV